MSTKNSLVYGPKFHLYNECFDSRSHVWLELNGCQFEASGQYVLVEIPIAIWEVIRQQTTAKFDLAGLSNPQLQAEAEKRVDAQRTDYTEALSRVRSAGNAKKKKFKAWLNLGYGDARLPRAEHLATTVEHLRKERASQRKLRREIARISPAPKANQQPLMPAPVDALNPLSLESKPAKPAHQRRA